MLSSCYNVIILSLISVVLGNIQVTDKGVIPLQADSFGLQLYFDIENYNRHSECSYLSHCTKSCLLGPDNKCEHMTVYGGEFNTIRPREVKTITFVYPTLKPYDLVGFCNILLSSQCNWVPRLEEKNLTIFFDTRLVRNKRKSNNAAVGSLLYTKPKKCESIDEDPLNLCLPVQCDEKYASKKIFFHPELRRCVKPVTCVSDDLENPDLIYVPRSNVCRDVNKPLTYAEVYEISSGQNVVTKEPSEDYVIVIQSNCSTLSQYAKLLQDLMAGKFLCHNNISDPSVWNSMCHRLAELTLGCLLGIIFAIVSVIFVINTMLWIYSTCSTEDLRDKYHYCVNTMKESMNKTNFRPVNVSAEVKDTLIREVITRDVPLELRDSVVDICERMNREVRWKKRYRAEDRRSDILKEFMDDVSSSSSVYSMEYGDEKTKLLTRK